MINSNSNHGYTFTMEPEKKKKSSYLKIVVCGQIFGILIFVIGFAAGLCVGIFIFHGNDGHAEKDTEIHKSASISHSSSEKPNLTEMDSNVPEAKGGGISLEAEKVNKLPEFENGEVQPVESCNRCVWNNPVRPSDGPNLFSPLTADEMVLVHKTLLAKKIINIDHGQEISFQSNFIATMFLYPPVKETALKFLDQNSEFPGRFATAVVIRGKYEQKDYMQYQVGPLDGPPSNVKVSKLLQDGEVPYEYRPYDNVEIGQIILFVLADLKKIPDLLKHSFDVNNVYEDITVMPNGPYNDGTGRTSRFTLGLRGLGNREFDFLNILPFMGRLYHGGQNVSEWYTFDYFYVNQGPYSNITELEEAYFNGDLEYVKYPDGYKEFMVQSTIPVRDIYLPTRPNSHFPGTSTFEPHGPRYTITGHKVNWLGWQFTVSTSQHRGPAIFDVRFREERIVYENSLNEIALVYSTNGNGQDNMVFLDSVYGLGESKRAIPRVDCPDYASYLNSTGWDPRGLRPVIFPTFCIFEVNAQEPLWRHKGEDVEGGLNNNFLVARYPTQVGNYDYIIDFQFYLDGRIKTTVSATGFIQGSFWNPSPDVNTPFGYRVTNTLIGPIHDHTFGFKVDMDISGTENDFQLVHWKSGNVNHTMMQSDANKNMTHMPNYFFYNMTRYLEWEKLDKETGLTIDVENQKYWTIINRNKKNKYGVERGYRIIPMATGSQNLPEDYPRMRELSFTKYHCAITKHKDNEQYLKPLYFPVAGIEANDSSPTQHYLEDMLNEESIANEDLVTWLSVGFLHIPTSEDVPMTIRVESGFTLKPFNYFDRTAVFDVPSLLLFNQTLYDNAPIPDKCVSNPTPITH